MRQQFKIGVAILASAVSCAAQVVASHAPTLPNAAVANSAPASGAPASRPSRMPMSGNPAANLGKMVTFTMPAVGTPIVKVNGAILTDRDLMREMQTIFPYSQIHNGVPASMADDMRKGAMDMIVFEELVYQEALKEKRTIAPERLRKAEIQFRKQFPTQQEYDQVVQAEVHGDKAQIREKIRRSLLIEDTLKAEVYNRAKVTDVAARAYYNANPKQFAHPELVSIQTISIIPPPTASADDQAEAKKKAENAIQQAKATKSYQEFGLLAEKISEDDWHVNMGDHKQVEAEKLPPPVLQAARKMKVGAVSEMIQLGPAYTIFRLNAHVAAGRYPFAEVKAKLVTDLQKSNTEKMRSALDKKLRKTAKIEVL
ncbi:MAG TPA: peptidyl-prolyl cis-trans isomerase [Verrucomicrobiae bacterium]|nr:peptidyl-prolyl cis-trans isomerase [Verrucomicrobiae bacterium]